jgi:hypothetical protein
MVNFPFSIYTVLLRDTNYEAETYLIILYHMDNDDPLLTEAFETNADKRRKLLPLLLPILCYLSKDIKLNYHYFGGNLE